MANRKLYPSIGQAPKLKEGQSALDYNYNKFAEGVRKVLKKPIESIRKSLTEGDSVSSQNFKKFGGQVFTKALKLNNSNKRLKSKLKK